MESSRSLDLPFCPLDLEQREGSQVISCLLARGNHKRSPPHVLHAWSLVSPFTHILPHALPFLAELTSSFQALAQLSMRPLQAGQEWTCTAWFPEQRSPAHKRLLLATSGHDSPSGSEDKRRDSWEHGSGEPMGWSSQSALLHLEGP